jgi:hypothetical protein
MGAQMKTSVAVFSFFLAMAFWSADASAQCYRHFYNNSMFAWSVQIRGARGSCNPDGSRICQIAPLSVATLYYDGTQGYPNWITMRSQLYAEKTYFVQQCRIEHDGSTGSWIAVNSPADGDVVTCGGFLWPCPAIPFEPKRLRK